MGGKAFPELNMIRLSADQYKEFSLNILSTLHQKFPGYFNFIPSFRAKESFGDLDLIFYHLNPIDVHKLLGEPPMVRNGPATSFAIPVDYFVEQYISDTYFQVDIIHVRLVEMECALGYFSYNDLGNLLGRIFHRAGFKLGHRGLSYIVRDEQNFSNAIQEIFLSHDWKTCLEFAGYDYEKWTHGFETLEDVFKYAASNSIVSQKMFRLDQTNHQARVRDKKRKTYQEFLKWIELPENQIPFDDVIEKTELRRLFFEKAMNQFPHFKEEYKRIQELLQKRKLAKEKYNGKIVSELTGLMSKELGEFIMSFENEYLLKRHKLNKVDFALSQEPWFIARCIQYWFYSKWRK